MNESARNAAVALIQYNIATYGHHVYVIASGPLPRFAYTIGLHGSSGSELVFCGGAFFSTTDVHRIVNDVARHLRGDSRRAELTSVDIGSLGVFHLKRAHSSWTNALLLGALDFLSIAEVQALQIVPDRDRWTLDVPDLSREWNATVEPVWQWLHQPWTYGISPQAVAVTNLQALRGARVTEAARWEENEWEVFAGSGPDVPPEEMRKVPIATLLAADDSLMAVTSLGIGNALWRDAEGGQWQKWGNQGSTH